MVSSKGAHKSRLNALMGASLGIMAVSVGCLCQQSEAKTTIKFWHDWNGEGGEAVSAIVSAYNKAQSRVEVRMTYTSDINQKLLTAVAAGASPDVVLFDRYLTANYAARKVLTPLDSRVKSDGISAASFFRAPWRESQYLGRTYSIPFSTDSRVLFYNKELFQVAGLDANRGPKTWDDLVFASKKLTRRDANGRLLQVGYVPTWDNVSLVHYIWQNGGDVFDPDAKRVTFNQKPSVDALDWVVDFTDFYGESALRAFAAGFSTNSFYRSQVAMKSEGCWVYGDLKANAKHMLSGALGLSHLPYRKEAATIAGGFSMVIPAGSREADSSWEFIKYASSKDQLVRFATATGSIPAVRSAAQDDSIERDAFYRPFVEALEYAHYRPNHPAFPDIEPGIYTAVQRAIEKRGTPKQLLDAAAELAQKTLDRYNKHFRM